VLPKQFIQTFGFGAFKPLRPLNQRYALNEKLESNRKDLKNL